MVAYKMTPTELKIQEHFLLTTAACFIFFFFYWVCMCGRVYNGEPAKRYIWDFEIESKAPITGFWFQNKKIKQKKNVLESMMVNKDMAKITASQTTLFCKWGPSILEALACLHCCYPQENQQLFHFQIHQHCALRETADILDKKLIKA